MSTVGIFLPSFLLILVVAPILIRHRDNRNVQGFVKGAYAAAIGTILGAGVLLGRIAIGDWLTALIGLTSLIALGFVASCRPLMIECMERILRDGRKTHCDNAVTCL